MTRLMHKMQALAFGRYGETLCCMVLRLKGYRIVKRNHQSPFGEVDIIALKGKTLCFIEVKSRRTKSEALGAIRPAQQKRIMRTAMSFLCAHSCYGACQIRFDVMAVTPLSWPSHLKNAWGEE